MFFDDKWYHQRWCFSYIIRTGLEGQAPHAEEEAAEFIAERMTKPVSAYVAGVTAPPGKKMGHAGAIVSGGRGTAAAKMEALSAAGVRVGLNPTEAGELMAEIVAELD